MQGRVAVPAALLISITIFGCGAPAAPKPPSLNLPEPVVNLSGVRVGNRVRLTWTLPVRTTDRVAIVHPIPVQICRAVQGGPCERVGDLVLAAGGAATYADDLPPQLSTGPEQVLRYEVELRNRAGKSAGPSNAVYSASGDGPPALKGFSATVEARGVQLNWQPAASAPASFFFRIERLQLTTEAPDQKPRLPLAAATAAAAQTLVVHLPQSGIDPGHAVDASALFNQKYRYVMERVAEGVVAGHTVEVQGDPSQPLEVVTTDVFPPAVPLGLVAVADTAGGAIDLAWSPNFENDLAEYRVYRRDAQANVPAQRIAATGLGTSFRDTGVQPGHTYLYAVSAVDQTGNESQLTANVEETLPR